MPEVNKFMSVTEGLDCSVCLLLQETGETQMFLVGTRSNQIKTMIVQEMYDNT